jgi:hypothetical protein
VSQYKFLPALSAGAMLVTNIICTTKNALCRTSSIIFVFSILKTFGLASICTFTVYVDGSGQESRVYVRRKNAQVFFAFAYEE